VRDAVVLRALGLGDFLTGVPALRALREAFPRHRISLVAPPAIEPLALLSGTVDAVIPYPPADPVDVAVNLHGKGPESHWLLLGIPPRRLIAFANAKVTETAGLPEWRADEHEVERWCRLLEESGIRADPSRLELPVPRARAVPGATLIHPGAASPARRWPAERYAAVARAVLRKGHRVLVTGAPEEEELVERVARLAPGAEPALGTTLLELASFVASARRVVCGDTGVAHLAAAYGTPSVVLFGPTPPSLWGPPPNGRHRVLWKGRVGDPHAAEPHDGLLEIEVEEVLAAL
jgi:ADP-heptose:LPS heptosyltransferase